MTRRWIAVAFLLLVAGHAMTHEVRPAYLRIADASTTFGQDRFDFIWRVPTGAPIPLTIFVQMPEGCSIDGEILSWQDAGYKNSRWVTHCSLGLIGQSIEIGDLNAAVVDVLVRFERLNGTTQVVRLTPTKTDFVVQESESQLEVAQTYLTLGVEHILLGIDHLLFVLALLLIVDGLRNLFWTVTAFTAAHSVTLAGAALGFVNVPQKPVEAVIALSIVFVAMEIIHWRQGRPGLTRERPWIVAFVFGLLHGLGFAGALSEIGLPEHAIPMSLLFFNVGVEVGQLLFVIAALLVAAILKRIRPPEWTWRILVYGIGSVAMFWTIERVAGVVT